MNDRRISRIAMAALVGLSASSGLPAAERVGVKPQHAAVTAAPGSLPGWQQEHERLNEIAQRGGGELVFLGGSHIAGWADQGQPAWRQYYGDRRAVNLGIRGDRTEQVLWRIAHGNFDGYEPALIVLQIGDANLTEDVETKQQTIDGVVAVVHALRKKLPQTRVLLLGLFPRNAAGQHPLHLGIREVNQAISHAADWQHVHFIDVGHTLFEPQGQRTAADAADISELSETAYLHWAKAIEFKVAELLQEEDHQLIQLFDGSSLTGWQAGDDTGPPKGWKVVDGTMAIVGRGDDAQTTQHFSAGPEYQIIDDLSRRLPPSRNNATAATVDMFGPAEDKPVRPTGNWNHSRIVAEQGNVEHWLNGARVLTFDIESKEWKKQLDKSKFRRLWPFGRLYEGAFRLQNYGGMPVYYRDITVMQL